MSVDASCDDGADLIWLQQRELSLNKTKLRFYQQGIGRIWKTQTAFKFVAIYMTHWHSLAFFLCMQSASCHQGHLEHFSTKLPIICVIGSSILKDKCCRATCNIVPCPTRWSQIMMAQQYAPMRFLHSCPTWWSWNRRCTTQSERCTWCQNSRMDWRWAGFD